MQVDRGNKDVFMQLWFQSISQQVQLLAAIRAVSLGVTCACKYAYLKRIS